MHYYKFNIGDYASHTRHLSLMEDLAYRRLLDVAYTSEKPLSKDIKSLSRLLGMRENQAEVEEVLREFFVEREDGWVHPRVIKEIEATGGKSQKASESARNRWGETDDENKKNRSERLSAARKLGTHSAGEWQALKHICGDACLKCGEITKLVKDHITPIYQGGSDSIDNLQPLCTSCNSSKGSDSTDHRPSDWKEALAVKIATDAGVSQALNTETPATHYTIPTTHNPLPTTQDQLPKTEKSKAIASAPADTKKTAATMLAELGVEEQPAKDWLTIRKAKRAPLTQTALDDLVREAGKAGISVNEAVTICARRSWQGFNASWDWKGTTQSAAVTRAEQIARHNEQVAKEFLGEQASKTIEGEVVHD